MARLPASDTPVPVPSPVADGATSQEWDRLLQQVSRFPGDPYLLTVTAENRPHYGIVTVRWDVADRRLLVAAPSSWLGSAESGYCQVSLIWPPPEPDGRSLIVDGDACSTRDAGEKMLAIHPTRAVLYRPGQSRPGTDASCGSDCIPILSR